MEGRNFLDDGFAAEAPALFWDAWVEDLRLVRAGEHVGQLARAPHLASVYGLDLGDNGLHDEGVRLLADSPHLGRLRRLGLANNALGAGAVRALADSPHLGRLTDLDLRNNRLDDSDRALAALLRLLHSPLGQRLRRLELHGNDLNEEAWAAYAEWRREHP